MDFVLRALSIESENVRTLLLGRTLDADGRGAQTELAGLNQEQQTVLKAVQAVSQGDYQLALTSVQQVLPFVALDRLMSAIAHWIGAVALAGLGRTQEAAYWCSLAADQARSPRGKSVEVGVLCTWAEVTTSLGNQEEGLARSRLALRRAREPHQHFHAHLTAARLWWLVRNEKADYHLDLARQLAITPQHHQVTVAIEPISLAAIQQVTTGTIKVCLLSGMVLQVNGANISAAGSPRAALLLAYLIQNDGESIAEIAEQILPPDVALKPTDKAKSDWQARVRQHLNQVRQLVGDPSAVVCKNGRLWLSKQYRWESDLRLAVLHGTFRLGDVLPILLCPWLEELAFTVSPS